MRKIGTGLIVSGFFIWVSVLFGNKFVLTESTFLEKVAVEHQEVLRSLLKDMVGKEYGNVFLFSTKIRNAVEEVNAKFDATESWDKKIYIKYELELSKASAQGFWKDNPEAQWFLCFLPIIIGAFVIFYYKIKKMLVGFFKKKKPSSKCRNRHRPTDRGAIGGAGCQCRAAGDRRRRQPARWRLGDAERGRRHHLRLADLHGHGQLAVQKVRRCHQ